MITVQKLKQWCKNNSVLLNQLPGAVMVVNKERRIEFCNDQFNHLLGYQSEDLAGEKLWMLVDDEQVKEMAAELQQKAAIKLPAGFPVFEALATLSKDYNKIWNVKKKLGGNIPFVLSFGLINDDANTVLGFIAVAVVAKELETKAQEQKKLTLEYKHALEALSASQRRYQQIFSYAPLGIFQFDENSVVLDANQHIIDLLYTKREFLVGMNMLQELKDTAVLSAVKSCLETGVGAYEGMYQTLHGNSRPMRGLFKAVLNSSAKIIGGVGVFEDISERYRIKQALLESEKSYREIFDNAKHTICIQRKDGSFLNVNKATETMYGYSVEEIIGKSPKYILAPNKNNLADINERLRQCWLGYPQEFEFWGKKKNGEVFPSQVSVTLSTYFGEDVLIIFAKDISDRKAVESKIKALANEDSLTGLPNRRLLIEHSNKLIKISKRNNVPLSLLYLDLDKFKDINDTLGHDAGDELLKKTGKRLLKALRETDTLARLGGDEFAILLPDASEIVAKEIALRVIKELHKPFQVMGNQVVVQASIGIASYPQDGDNFQKLFRNVDIAMYQAKKNQSSIAFFKEHFGEDIKKRVDTENDLSRAITDNQLLLHFQPKIQLANNKPIGVEALVRWQHPSQGLLYPDKFIPIAEKSNLINKLGLWVINKAIEVCKSWINDGIHLPIAVNISVRELLNRNLVPNIKTLLENYALPAEYLEIELTETVVMQNTTASLKTLTQLSDMGIKISIDDFGTGYSSLNYLKQLPADYLKIDRSFVFGIQNTNDFDSNDASIIKAIVALADSMGLGLIAEGVEIEAQEIFLKSIGVKFAQGYKYSKAIESNQLLKWLK